MFSIKEILLLVVLTCAILHVLDKPLFYRVLIHFAFHVCSIC